MSLLDRVAKARLSAASLVQREGDRIAVEGLCPHRREGFSRALGRVTQKIEKPPFVMKWRLFL